jgi:hypothetical protein
MGALTFPAEPAEVPEAFGRGQADSPLAGGGTSLTSIALNLPLRASSMPHFNAVAGNPNS